MKKRISIIVAVAENNAIGKENKLLWHISEDLKRFKRLTSGNTVVMGKNTFYSLPLKPLPNRTNIVITDIPGEKIDGCVMAYSIDDAIKKCDDSKENFIIGGGSIYRQFLPLSDKLYLTKIHKNFDADCFFPEINFNEWKLMSREECNDNEKNDFSYSYLIFEKLQTT
ncbi:MAG: dihydrofolate reductase [Bacteroidales bacterium]